jgi:CheY-like chemotaxis protein/HPt (histidine-containing phosphotransfer) domain-containing protein
VNDLRAQFQARFVAAANERLRRALAALSANPTVVYQELHGLAGEAGIIGYAEISNAAAAGLQVARAWRTAKPTSDQQLQCARILRSLLTLVNELERGGSAPQRAAVGTTRTALVVDDSELIAEELADALRGAGFETAVASTIDGAASAARESRPDIVLVDANLPGIDLRVLCDRIREHAIGAKLIIVSASTEDELKAFAKHVRADGYVGKLGGTARILERVQALLGTGAS